MPPNTNVSHEEVNKVLAGTDYQHNKQSLIKHAKKKGASDEIVSALNGLP